LGDTVERMPQGRLAKERARSIIEPSASENSFSVEGQRRHQLD